MIKPMLASPMSKAEISDWTEWAIEQKYDGHRMQLHVHRTETGIVEVSMFARPRGDGRMIERGVPDHIRKEAEKLPDCILDGELVGGDVSTDVSRLDLVHALRFVVFDVLKVDDVDWRGQSYDVRREALVQIFKRMKGFSSIQLTASQNLKTQKDVALFVKMIWAQGGEGAILKLRRSTYVERRSPNWLKIKRVEHDILPIIGFEASRGTVMGRGQFAIVTLQGDGKDPKKWPSCKTLNDEELAKFKKRDTMDYAATGRHPDIGRMLMIEHFGRTRDGGYRGPVTWDRWEDE